jgi:hypothetical protein
MQRSHVCRGHTSADLCIRVRMLCMQRSHVCRGQTSADLCIRVRMLCLQRSHVCRGHTYADRPLHTRPQALPLCGSWCSGHPPYAGASYVSIRQHTSAFVSIRTSAYASAGAAIMRKLVQRAPSICRRIVYSRHRRVELTILPSGEAVRPHIRLATRILCQYLYFCTSKASKLSSVSNLALR